MNEKDPDLAARKKLSFEQAEGAAPLPSQLSTGEISQELRAHLWAALYKYIANSIDSDIMGHGSWFKEPWRTILTDKHLFRDHKMVDEFPNGNPKKVIADLKVIYVSGSYVEILGTTQWFLRHPSCPNDFKNDVAFRLKYARAAYQLFDSDTIAPISSEQEAKTLEAALNATRGAGFGGVRVHLKNAAQELTAGNWAPSTVLQFAAPARA